MAVRKVQEGINVTQVPPFETRQLQIKGRAVTQTEAYSK